MGEPSAIPPPTARGRAPVRAIRKRDGDLVAYAAERIVGAVERAQHAVGEVDPLFAVEVAEVVGLALAARSAPAQGPAPKAPLHAGPPSAAPGPAAPAARVPDVEEIQDLVEEALIQMGRTRVAKAYILYRDRRRRRRDALRVGPEADPAAPIPGEPRAPGAPGAPGGGPPLVREGTSASAWNRARIVAALVDAGDLPRETAEGIAKRVEDRVLAAGLRRLSTALVRELVRAELGAAGHREAARRQEPLSISRRDLARELGARDAGDARRGGLDARIAAPLLRRYAVEDVLDSSTEELCRAGDLDLEDLERPHLALARAVPIDLVVAGEVGPRSAFALLEPLARLARTTSHSLVLEDSGRLLRALAPRGLRTGRGRSSGPFVDWLHGLAAVAAGSGCDVLLGPLGGRSPGVLGRLLDDLALCVRDGARVPRLCVSWPELSAALAWDSGGEEGVHDAAEMLLARGALTPVWNGSAERWAAPGCRRRTREVAVLRCAAAATLNLPRLARRAGPWREEALFEALLAKIQAGLDALARLVAFQREMRPRSGGLLPERYGVALSPVGLFEALRILGDGQVRPAQGARLLGFCADAVRRVGAERGVDAVLSPFFGDRAARRFARLDRPGARQGRLFEGLPEPETERSESYSRGFSLARTPLDRGPTPGPVEVRGDPYPELAQLLVTVESGALLAPPRVDQGVDEGPDEGVDAAPDAERAPAPDAHPRLRAWERFDSARAVSAISASSSGSLRAGPPGAELFLSDPARSARA